MTLTAENTEGQARILVDRYLADTMGPAYGAGPCRLQNGRMYFRIKCKRNDMHRAPIVGGIAFDLETGQIAELPSEQICNFRESSEVQAAHDRRELARGEDGFVLRLQARIKASVWISDRVDLKVSAKGGVFLPLDTPIWRFSLCFHREAIHLELLGVIDVNAQTGEVIPLPEVQLQSIRESVNAALRAQKQATAA